MVLKTRNKALTRIWKYEAGQPVIDVLPRDNMLRRVSLHLDLELETPDGAVKGVGLKNADSLNILKRIEIILEGNDNIFDIDLRTYYEAMRFGYGTASYKDAIVIPDVGSKTLFHVEIPIDFAFDRKQISDTRALLPAQILGSLEMRLTWGLIGDILTTPNGTIVTSASKVRVSIIEVYDNQADSGAIQGVLDNLTKIYEGVQQDELTSEHDSYPASELPIQIRPVSALHLQTIMCGLSNITDGDPEYSNAVVKQVKLENVKGGGEAIFHDYFEDLQRVQKTDFGFETDNPIGRVIIDYSDIRFGGLSNNDPDALKWKLLNPAPTANKVNAVRSYKKYIVTGV